MKIVKLNVSRKSNELRLFTYFQIKLTCIFKCPIIRILAAIVLFPHFFDMTYTRSRITSLTGVFSISVLRGPSERQGRWHSPRQMFLMDQDNTQYSTEFLQMLHKWNKPAIVNAHISCISHEFILLFPTVNPCCYLPCQHRGVCVRYAEDKYECDCTRTGYYGENCTVRESIYSYETNSFLLFCYSALGEFEIFPYSFVH